MKDYYEILEINETASLEVIQRVYKLLAKKYHPDLQEPTTAKEAEEKFKEVAEAYEILSNEGKRKAYDEQLKAFKESQRIDSANSPDFAELQNYCSQLENQLHSMQNTPVNNNTTTSQPQTRQNPNNSNVMQAQQEAYNQAMNKAYQDAYHNTLRSMGYRIRYKKTFKENFKNFVALTLTGIILIILGYIAWQIPSVQEMLRDLFTFNII